MAQFTRRMAILPSVEYKCIETVLPMSMENDINQSDLIERAIAESDAVSLSKYNPQKAYPRPITDPHHGRSQNGYASNSGLVPPETVNFLGTCDTVAQGVAIVAEDALRRFAESDGYKVSNDDIYGTIVEIACRFGMGALGEDFAKKVLEAMGHSLKRSEPGDEKDKIDLRVARPGESDWLIQVKLADDYRTDWAYPDALIWVKPGGSAYLRTEGRGMDGWEKLG